MFKSNTHTHTYFCDGKNSPEEIIKKAIELGFVSLGFSGHSPMFFENDYAIKAEKFSEYYNEIEILKNAYSEQIEIYNGIELDKDCVDLSSYKFDYVIASVHQIHMNNKIYYVDYSAEVLTECVNIEFNGSFIKMAKHYYDEFTKFIIDVKPDIVGHFDLIEKFNSNKTLFDTDSDEYKEIVRNAVKVIAENCPGQIFEVNTGAMYRLKNDLIYPSSYIMECIKEYGMNVTINSDSHCVNSLVFGFETALNYCRNHGFKSVYMLKNGIFEEICI